MNLYETIKKYGKGKGEDVMWKALPVVSKAVEEHMTPEEEKSLVRKIYCIMSGGHYNEEFAREDVSKMYYIDRRGERHNAPYWMESDVYSIYQSAKGEIPEYNRWDWFVAFQMIASDNWCLLGEWFPEIDKDDFADRVRQMTLNWLKDEDNPYGSEKIWKYLNR